MRFILILSLLVTFYVSASAATAHQQRRHAIVRHHHGMIYPPHRGAVIYSRRAPFYNGYNEPYFGASQGYAPGEKERFLESVMNPY